MNSLFELLGIFQKQKKKQNHAAVENVCSYQFVAPNAQHASEDVEEKQEEGLRSSNPFVKSGEHGADSSNYLYSCKFDKFWQN